MTALYMFLECADVEVRFAAIIDETSELLSRERILVDVGVLLQIRGRRKNLLANLAAELFTVFQVVGLTLCTRLEEVEFWDIFMFH
jgi:hypothetical protein